MIKNLLPIGSVVKLKGGQKRLMIYGLKQIDPEGEKIEYDYVGVFYPEGNIGLQAQFLFNHTDIEEIQFRGFDDKERSDFIKKLVAYYETKEQSQV